VLEAFLNPSSINNFRFKQNDSKEENLRIDDKEDNDNESINKLDDKNKQINEKCNKLCYLDADNACRIKISLSSKFPKGSTEDKYLK